ncbi:hypothetical protein GLOTRDRAFT_92697 [Gloeophyllum trabeum ATCC 11539]|uniref:Ig-like domain-containing protein n=1 Tax=Gloeophyllum trabeum (strain ATCC 11539 / FP-39264 / Madison 617) TaxID=670483 RepID=S7RSV2_GLOTA|nr:uncharacterized protein GLOTRDRAFT_92697 [Gloeophyllum trabeum ATCC 11539]EPQ56154.1 hypothetical protein GLOTRDRAFT_92697 [Gloeophyllum trabeum ATCC 11539]
MQLNILATLVAMVVAVKAAPSDAHHEVRSIEARSGCGSSGPLGDGHYEWWGHLPPKSLCAIPDYLSLFLGQRYNCQAMDASGCEPGQVNHIGSMEVDDPNDTTQYAKQGGTNSVGFTCPAGGQVRCQANFNDNDDGPGYSLRVVSA